MFVLGSYVYKKNKGIQQLPGSSVVSKVLWRVLVKEALMAGQSAG